MNNLKNSSSLDAILAYAKGFDSRKGETVNCSRFLLSVIDTVNGVSQVEIGAEDRERLRGMLKQAFPNDGADFEQARGSLLEHIRKSDIPSYKESLALQKHAHKAADVAADRGRNEVSPDILLECVLKDPDEFLKTILSSAPAAGKQDNESSRQIPSPEAFTRSVPRQPEQGSEPERPAEKREPDTGTETDRRVLMENLTLNVRTVRDALSRTVFGQEHAIDVFISGYFQSQLTGHTDLERNRPTTFLLAGPPGVGKTFLVKSIVKLLDMEEDFRLFDMTQYTNESTVMDLTGHGANWRTPDEGLLTGFARKHPKCILLFDEIEKACPEVIHLFLRLLDEGVLMDTSTKKNVSFRDALIFFTTNAGKQLYSGTDAVDFSGVSRKVIINALKQDVDPHTRQPCFPDALCSRFSSGNVVMFNHMTAASLCRIARAEIMKKASAYEEYGIKFSFEPDVFTSLLFAEGAGVDARSLRGRAEKFYDVELYELLRLLSSEEHEGNIRDLKEIRFGVELPAEGDILTLFRSDEKHRVLAYASAEDAGRWEEQSRLAALIPVGDMESAKTALQKKRPQLAVIDLLFGVHEERRFLNIEDMDSTARDLFWHVRTQYPDLPVFILQHSGCALSGEEQKSFLREGVRGFITVDGEGNGGAEEIDRICREMYQQDSMRKLAASNSLVTYQSGQRILEEGAVAEVVLFDYRQATAVDAKDTANVMSDVSKPNVHFSDIIGAKTAKEELQFFIEYLKDPRQFADDGLRVPRGVLLYGPPGTGKTMLAKAVAAEAGVTFISAEGNEFLKSYVGQGKDRLHEKFDVARKYAPSILFIDEFEAIAQERKGGENSFARGEDVLTALLTEMDGFHTDPSRPVFVLAATNFDVKPGGNRSLDQALLRRFDSLICVDLPNKEDRIKLLKFRRDGNKAFVFSDEEIDNIALRSTGMSPANLDNVLEMALRIAIRRAERKVTDEVLDEAFETFLSGDKKAWDPSELLRTARHEAGHTFLCWQSGEDPTYVTVVARGDYGGYMLHGDETKGSYTKEELLARIRISLGGRAAETVYYGEQDGASTGASADLVSATDLARRIICSLGMDREFGLAVIDQQAAQYGELSLKVREAVNAILEQEMQKAVQLIGANRACIDALVDRLMTDNHLNGEEIRQVFRENGGSREKK